MHQGTAVGHPAVGNCTVGLLRLGRPHQGRVLGAQVAVHFLTAGRMDFTRVSATATAVLPSSSSHAGYSRDLWRGWSAAVAGRNRALRINTITKQNAVPCAAVPVRYEAVSCACMHAASI